jgi:hypothetical protein
LVGQFAGGAVTRAPWIVVDGVTRVDANGLTPMQLAALVVVSAYLSHPPQLSGGTALVVSGRYRLQRGEKRCSADVSAAVDDGRIGRDRSASACLALVLRDFRPQLLLDDALRRHRRRFLHVVDLRSELRSRRAGPRRRCAMRSIARLPRQRLTDVVHRVRLSRSLDDRPPRRSRRAAR